MANLKFHKVATLPGTPDVDAMYFVPETGPSSGSYAAAYVTNNTGVPVQVAGATVFNEYIAAALASVSEIQLAADITARDALTLTMNSLVLVTDASADATVDLGAAMYFWDNTGATFIKVTEFESLDVITDWTDVQNRPASSVAAIDQAVTDSHTHPNKPVIDAITSAGSGVVISAAERTQISTNVLDISNLQADSHTHTNKTELDKISEDGNGCMLYDGDFPMAWSTNAW